MKCEAPKTDLCGTPCTIYFMSDDPQFLYRDILLYFREETSKNASSTIPFPQYLLSLNFIRMITAEGLHGRLNKKSLCEHPQKYHDDRTTANIRMTL